MLHYLVSFSGTYVVFVLIIFVNILEWKFHLCQKLAWNWHQASNPIFPNGFALFEREILLFLRDGFKHPLSTFNCCHNPFSGCQAQSFCLSMIFVHLCTKFVENKHLVYVWQRFCTHKNFHSISSTAFKYVELLG